MKLLKTGVAGLDEFLLGGLPPKIILLSGSPGSGNEVFARQILFNLAKQSPVTYFTVNCTPESIKEDMTSYGWDTTPLEESGMWKFKSIQATTPSAITETVLSEMKQQKTVAIDSISELLLSHKPKDIANLLTSMARQNRKSQQYHLLMLTEGMQDSLSETTMQHFAEGSITFALTWAADSTLRHVIIRKMTGTLIPTRRLPYTIGKKGFIIETATRIS
jgi:KaiC/GvpD/RAD55 family RecA-like ATPase